MKDKPSPDADSKVKVREFGSTVESNKIGYESSNQSERECVKKLGAIRKTYHFNFKDDDETYSKSLTGNQELSLSLIIHLEHEREILDFHKLELLGQGEISDVYKAVNLRTQEPFVIKTFCVS